MNLLEVDTKTWKKSQEHYLDKSNNDLETTRRAIIYVRQE